MLFNSYAFILVFLPATLCLFFWAGRVNSRLAALVLVGASLYFYAVWSPVYLLLLLASITVNYCLGKMLAEWHETGRHEAKGRLLIAGVIGNLLLLGYFKYANFFVSNWNSTFSTDFALPNVLLPIGISFFTFTQIAFLVDAAAGKAKEYDPIHYCLFVTYFPHLVAGPILHHKEMMPQFSNPSTYRFNPEQFAPGLTLFCMGLFKKLVFADSVASYASPVFNAAKNGYVPSLLEAWAGALSYALQLYFDFSGYSDMAIGLSLMFAVRLPINFDSPYQATNIIEFWRRWHITLSRFLRDYLYIPLGGNRKGWLRRYGNLLITMLLGGFWHGANWTFVIWGALHGFYLVLNHGWRVLLNQVGLDAMHCSPLYRLFSGGLTFLAVVVAWVFFRAETLDAAYAMLKGMSGSSGLLLPGHWANSYAGGIVRVLVDHGAILSNNQSLLSMDGAFAWIAGLLGLCWLAPNTVTLFNLGRIHQTSPWVWKPSAAWVAVTVILGFTSVLAISDLSEFIYFQF